MSLIVWCLSLCLGASTFRPGFHYGVGSQFIVGLSCAVMAIVGGWFLVPALIISGHCLGWKAASATRIVWDRYQSRLRSQIVAEVTLKSAESVSSGALSTPFADVTKI